MKHWLCNLCLEIGSVENLFQAQLILQSLQTDMNELLIYLINMENQTYWCSIWKFRWPVNQSLKKDFSMSQVAFICSFSQGLASSVLIFMGIWFDWDTHVNQWLSITLENKQFINSSWKIFHYKSTGIKGFLFLLLMMIWRPALRFYVMYTIKGSARDVTVKFTARFRDSKATFCWKGLSN